MKSKFLMLSATAYSIQSRENNEIIRGMTLFFYPMENLNPTENPQSQNTDKGKKPMKVNAPFDMQHKVQAVPGLYECTMEMRTGTDGKAYITVTDFDFISTLETVDVTPVKAGKPEKF